MLAQDKIVSLLPYDKPFLFVDTITSIDENGVIGNYTFGEDSFFYQGHFKEYPVTPGVILTECCAQIGLVCLGLYLLDEMMEDKEPSIAMTNNEMEYLKPVFPNEKVRVESEKVFFRFNKLKCKVKMFNTDNEVVCRGVLSGMLIISGDEK